MKTIKSKLVNIIGKTLLVYSAISYFLIYQNIDYIEKKFNERENTAVLYPERYRRQYQETVNRDTFIPYLPLYSGTTVAIITGLGLLAIEDFKRSPEKE